MSDWRDRARCRNIGVDLFYPIGHVGSDVLDGLIADALAYCRRCPVKDDCLTFALDNNESFGIWGGVRFDGLHATTKTKMRKQLRRAS